MSNIEPTEEQKQAATAFARGNGFWSITNDLARLLAEREAKLRAEVAFMDAGSQADYNAFAEALQKEDTYLAEINLLNERLAEMREIDGRKSRMLYDRDVVIDTLRARVAELERPNWLTTPTRSTRSRKDRLKEARERETALTKRVAELGQAAGEVNDALGVLDLCMVVPLVRGLEAREAQHLADIKALSARVVDLHKRLKRAADGYPPSRSDGACRQCVGPDVDIGACEGFVCWRHTPLPTAHYDDAKADAPVRDFSVRRAEADAVWARIERVVDAKADAPAPPKFRAFDVTERPVAMDAVAGCPKCSDDARPVSDGERWVCSVCRRPCRIPINDTEGGEG